MKDVIKGTAEAEGTWNQVLPDNTAENPPAEYEQSSELPEPEITTEPETMNESNWLQDYYAEHNIGGVGGVLDQTAIDYWEKEAATKGIDPVLVDIKNTAEAEGTWNQVPNANPPANPPANLPANTAETPPVETPPVETPPADTPAANTNAIAAEDVSGYLKGLYNSAFGRDADQAGLDYWGNAIQQGEHGDRDWREWLASSIYKSDEYTGGNTAAPTTDNKSLTMNDLTSFFNERDAAANNNSSGGMDKFMQFMMFMNMMRPQGGFGGGSQYGYGGLNPGGVQSAYNPMDDFGNYMNNFKSLSSGLIN